MKRKLLATILALSMIGGLTACTSSNSSSAATPSPAAPTAPSAPSSSAPVGTPDPSKDSLVVAMTRVGNNLDGSVANDTNISIITGHIYDDIIGVNESFEFEPAVAKSWEQVDSTTFKMTIGDGFVFHNGEPLKLEDVIFSIERNHEIPKRASTMSNVKSVEATGDKEITITLKEPNSATVREIMGFAQVYNKAYCESAGEAYANAPIGTGPYVVKNYVPGDKIELTAWADYPFEKPVLKNITFKGIEENANRYIAVETGEAQFAAINYQDLARAQGNDKMKVENVMTTNTAFISMNNQKPPFDNKNVRLAMAYATDKAGLATIEGGATVIDSMTPPMFATHYTSPNIPAFDLEKAKALLEQEGYNASNPLKFETWVYGGKTKVMEAYQATLKAIGVDMTITNMEFGVFLDGMSKGEYQMLGGSWNNVTGNPLVALENYWTGSYGIQNIAFYNNPEADELYNAAKAEADPVKLNEIAKELQELAVQDMPIIPTYSISAIFAMDKTLQNVRILGSSMYSFRNAYFA